MFPILIHKPEQILMNINELIKLQSWRTRNMLIIGLKCSINSLLSASMINTIFEI